MNLVRCLSPSFSLSLAGTVLCVLVVTTPTYGQTQATAKAADSPPQWAYPENNPNYKPPVDDGNVVRVPNSTASYTWSQLRDRFIAPIWHPGDGGRYIGTASPTPARKGTAMDAWETVSTWAPRPRSAPRSSEWPIRTMKKTRPSWERAPMTGVR